MSPTRVLFGRENGTFGLPTTFLCRTCRRLAEEKGVVCTPMSVFYASEIFARAPCTLVRFTVCKSREHIQRAVDQMLAD